jgi:hypothetical protein
VADDERVQPTVLTIRGEDRNFDPVFEPLHAFILAATLRGHRIHVETRGMKSSAWLSRAHWVTLCPDRPASEADWGPEHALKLVECIQRNPNGTSLRLRLDDEDDYQFARAIAQAIPRVPMYLVATDGDDYATWIDRVLADRWLHVRVQRRMWALSSPPSTMLANVV